MKTSLTLLLLTVSACVFGQQDKNIKTIFKVEKRHNFSLTTNKDLFKLTLKGENIFDGTVYFEIYASNGKKIYDEKFKVAAMMEFGTPGTDKAFKRSKEDSSAIIAVMNQFFDEQNFLKPAIKDSLEMKDNYSSFEKWDIIWQERTPIGFHYLLGAEDGRSIAYSTKKKKVILYFTCC
jgi:hypothetical protein